MEENAMEDLSAFEGPLTIPFTVNYLFAAAQYDLDGDGLEELIIVRNVPADEEETDEYGYSEDYGSTKVEVYKMQDNAVRFAGEQDLEYSIDFPVAVSGLRVYIYKHNEKTYLMFYNDYTGSAGGSGDTCVLCSYENGLLKREITMYAYHGSYYFDDTEVLNARENDEETSYEILQTALSPYGLTPKDLYVWLQPPEERICILNFDTKTKVEEGGAVYNYTLAANGTNDFTGHTADQNYDS